MHTASSDFLDPIGAHRSVLHEVVDGSVKPGPADGPQSVHAQPELTRVARADNEETTGLLRLILGHRKGESVHGFWESARTLEGRSARRRGGGPLFALSATGSSSGDDCRSGCKRFVVRLLGE